MEKADIIVAFLKEKGLKDDRIHEMLQKIHASGYPQRDIIRDNWKSLKIIGIQQRKLPYIVTKCPKIVTLDLDEKLVPTVQCLATLATKPDKLAIALKFPNILAHSVELKPCPLLAFVQALGIPEKQVGKMLLLNPWLISYSIDAKFADIVDFLVSLGMDKQGMVSKFLVKSAFIMGYNNERRLRPTTE